MLNIFPEEVVLDRFIDSSIVSRDCVTNLPRFCVTEILGESVVSLVAKARDSERNCEVALKRLTKRLYTLHNWDYPPLEAELRLRHPNIVQVMDVIVERDHLLLVLEYLPGGDLYHCFQEVGIFAEPLAKPLLSDLVDAVSFLHRSGVAHRDLKPENCILTADGTLKVADFGLATRFVLGERFVDFCGSPEYAAPEIKRMTPYEAPPVDVWAIGVILYEMCVGDLPPWVHHNNTVAAAAAAAQTNNNNNCPLSQSSTNNRNSAASEVDSECSQTQPKKFSFAFPESEVAEAALSQEFTQLLRMTLCENVSMRGTVESVACSPWLRSMKATLLAKEVLLEDLVQEIASAPLRERVLRERRLVVQEELGFE